MSEKMNMDAAPKIVSSLVKALQVVCHGYVEFDTNIEIVGHIHINVDREQKYNYVLNECVNRGDGRSSTFVSNSFYAKPPKDAVTERDRPPEPPIESDIMAFAASQYSESDINSRSAPMNSAAPVNHTQTYRLNKRDVQGNSIRHRPGATASSSISSSAPRVPPLHPAPTDSSYDPIVLDPAKRLRKSNSTDRLDESRRLAQSQRRAGSEERSRSDLPSEASIPSTSASLSSQQPGHTAASASASAALSDSSGDASRQAAQGLKEEDEEDVVLIKEEVCEEELLRACGGPVFPGDNFSQSHPPATATSRGDTSATETSSRGQTHSSDLSGSSYLGSGADYTGASTSYAEPHDSGQSHLYPVSLHANMMNTLPGSGGMSMMSPESATPASTSTATHPAFRSTDALPGRPGNSSSGAGEIDGMAVDGDDLPVFFPASSTLAPQALPLLTSKAMPQLSRGADHRKTTRLSPKDLVPLQPDASLFHRTRPPPLPGLNSNLLAMLAQQAKEGDPSTAAPGTQPPPPPSTTESMFACRLCSGTFYSRKQFLQHQAVDHEMPPACSVCGKEYKTVTGLEEHEVTHKGPRKFQCEYSGCTKSFSRRQHLEGHINHVHLALQPFRCDMCGATYASRNTCLNHMRTCKVNVSQDGDVVPGDPHLALPQLALPPVHSDHQPAAVPNVDLGGFQTNPSESWRQLSTSSSTSGGCDPQSPENNA